MSKPGRTLPTSQPVEFPQDQRVSRRKFVERMAWVSSAAATGTLLPGTLAAARPRGPSVLEEAYAKRIRPQALEDLTELSISESMTLIRNGTLEPADLVNAYVDRREALDPILQAYADRPTREALLEEAARTPAEGPLAPLRGICLTPKDNFYTADMLTEGGSLMFEGFQPDYDATAVTRMRAAGGLLLGKAQMGNLAGGRARRYGTTVPTTRNAWAPHDVGREPQGLLVGHRNRGRCAPRGLGPRHPDGGIGNRPGNGPGTHLRQAHVRTHLAARCHPPQLYERPRGRDGARRDGRRDPASGAGGARPQRSPHAGAAGAAELHAGCHDLRGGSGRAYAGPRGSAYGPATSSPKVSGRASCAASWSPTSRATRASRWSET